MNIIRPIQAQDYPALYEIAQESGIGFTSLPLNEAMLKTRIQRSEQSFNSDVQQPGSQSYLFVMEDSETGQILGTSGIEATVGLDDAFYHYHLGKVVHSSRELNVHNTIETLTFCNDYTGASEICTLFLREIARGGNNGRFLSKFRFLFMQQHQQRFADTIIAEMRGVSDDNGSSPFWEWLENHFFSMDFPTADYLSGIGNKVFIAELMPKYPIYVNLLSEAAQAVIGQVHEKTRPALQLLEQEGFRCRGYVDIFDAGPTVEASLQNIRTAQLSQCLPVQVDTQSAQSGTRCFVINTQVSDFRAVMTEVTVSDDQQHAIISSDAASALNINPQDTVRFAPVDTRG